MWRNLFLAPFLTLALLLASPAAAARFEAVVVRVKDGDSLVVERVREKRQSELRLFGIDAPELDQPWGIQSRTALRRLVGGKTVTVETTDRDRYGRLVARVWVGRTYVNAAMVWSGDAWAFTRFGPDKAIVDGQKAAKAAARGLWALPPKDRVPPATWRERNPRRDPGRDS